MVVDTAVSVIAEPQQAEGLALRIVRDPVGPAITVRPGTRMLLEVAVRARSKLSAGHPGGSVVGSRVRTSSVRVTAVNDGLLSL